MEVSELPTWCSSPARLQSTLDHRASFPILKCGLSAWTSETLPRLAELGDWSTDWEAREPMTLIHACFVGHILDQVGLRFSSLEFFISSTEVGDDLERLRLGGISIQPRSRRYHPLEIYSVYSPTSRRAFSNPSRPSTTSGSTCPPGTRKDFDAGDELEGHIISFLVSKEGQIRRFHFSPPSRSPPGLPLPASRLPACSTSAT